LLEILVLGVGIGQVVVLVFVASSTTEIAGDKANEEREYRGCQHSHHDSLDSVLSVYRVSCYLWSTHAVIALVRLRARLLSVSRLELIAISRLGLDVGLLAADGLARRASRVLACSDLRVEVRLVGPTWSAVRTTLADDFVPSTIRILESDAITVKRARS
jgi:hypothetical protein